MIYLTFNDNPSGIYISQVIDVVKYLSKEHGSDIKIVSFISIRNFSGNRKKIKKEDPSAIVIIMFPGVRHWRLNIVTLIMLSLFIDFKKVIARGPFATSLALDLKKRDITKKVCFDARGAYKAEFNEYNVSDVISIKKEIEKIEDLNLKESDYRIAVSNALVSYWGKNYNYNLDRHIVIPCTLNSGVSGKYPEKPFIKEARSKLKYSDEDIVLIYSGSSAGWQSLELIDNFLIQLLQKNEKIKIVFLVEKINDQLKIFSKYPDRVVHKWVAPNEVNNILIACDYGLLIREKSVTNEVASPTKFAEYLAAGLNVFISDQIGDYSGYVKEHNCGLVVDPNNVEKIELKTVSYEEKKRLNTLAMKHFTKESQENNYEKLMSVMNE